MKTFSNVSTPDLFLIRNSFLRDIIFINQLIETEGLFPEAEVVKLRKDLLRLLTLIEAIDVELLKL